MLIGIDPTVHPRVGGERTLPVIVEQLKNGSSPRGRGTRQRAALPRRWGRFIPAWAGNARRRWWHTPQPSVHPRVGGERPEPPPRSRWLHGSSPRGRGTRGIGPSRLPDLRFIPAWAGNATLIGSRLMRGPVHPRVGGERPCRTKSSKIKVGSSPRGRGTQHRAPVQRAAHPVHPRVGGERFQRRHLGAFGVGSSPRGRGTRFAARDRGGDWRFIPAWAGNAASKLSRR